jgi:hypothetical protein
VQWGRVLLYMREKMTVAGAEIGIETSPLQEIGHE